MNAPTPDVSSIKVSKSYSPSRMSRTFYSQELSRRWYPERGIAPQPESNHRYVMYISLLYEGWNVHQTRALDDIQGSIEGIIHLFLYISCHSIRFRVAMVSTKHIHSSIPFSIPGRENVWSRMTTLLIIYAV